MQKRLADAVRSALNEKFQLALENFQIDQPPKVTLGEYALPLAFELAKKLRKPPRKIAEEIVNALHAAAIPGFARFEVAGAGYINAYLDRAGFAQAFAREETLGEVSPPAKKVLVEHTSINPNKAAHVGHLRNAILGDTFVRLLRASGAEVSVQNYIDNTGVQVADVVVGFTHLEKRSMEEIRALT
ncbi:MAG TPA: arginine--tRNA ligase, partial [Terriglobales bacterium]|nr:arginine--tRNA ligase [Terriglobales bacterium]